MLKYEIYMKRHAAGMKLEYQTLAIVMMAHLDTTGHLQEREKGGNDCMPSWPDLEFALYAQDPAWVFLGGRPKSVQESKNKFSLAIGSSIANSERDIPINRLRININKLREFRETLTFGEGVFLPSDKFSEAKHNISTAKIEDITKRLVDTTASEHTWNGLGKQLLQSHSRPEDGKDTGTQTRLRNPSNFLETYAQWLQADMAGLFFDWLEMGILCADIWSQIRKRVEPLPGWDPTTFNDEKPAMEPAHDILLRDHNYPLFLEAAYNELLTCLDNTKASGNPKDIMGDVCLSPLGKHHHATAAMLRAPGPLSLENLYAHWPKEEWRSRWESMAKSPKD